MKYWTWPVLAVTYWEWASCLSMPEIDLMFRESEALRFSSITLSSPDVFCGSLCWVRRVWITQRPSALPGELCVCSGVGVCVCTAITASVRQTPLRGQLAQFCCPEWLHYAAILHQQVSVCSVGWKVRGLSLRAAECQCVHYVTLKLKRLLL